MPPRPNHPCHRCRRQFDPDEVMYLAAIGPRRYSNRVRTAAICEECLEPEEREIAAGITSYVPCYGCSKLMAPLVEPFRRSTCSATCAMRVERRRKTRKPLPLQTCKQCKQPFRPKRRGVGALAVRYCSTRCRTRAKDDRKLVRARAARPRQRACASCGTMFKPTRANHVACGHTCSLRLRRARARDDRRGAGQGAAECARDGRHGCFRRKLP
jgi:hypothetical protein